MSISDLILQAKAKKAQSVLFVVGSAPQVQQAGEWSFLRETPVLPSEWNILQQSVLSPQQQAILDTQGSVVGEGLFGGARVGFSFFQNEDTMKVWLNLELESEALGEGMVPPILVETALRRKGLILLAGQKENGLAAVLAAVLGKMNAEKTFSAVIFSAQAFPRLREDKALFVYCQAQEISRYNEEGLTAGVDVVVFHGYSDERSFQLALQLAEKGMLVIYDMIAPSIFNALRRAFGFLERGFGKHGVSRFSEILELALGQMGMRGLSQDMVYAYEILLMKQPLRHLIEKENLAELESVLKQAPENSGLVNANQALLQNLIRRRIDIKTAFEMTRDPDALDQLLKKVGI
jgi:twitching motility protein PilT